MKTLKIFQLWAFIFVLMSAFIGCDGWGNDPGKDPPDPPGPVLSDSVVVEVTLSTSSEVLLANSVVGIENPNLENGGVFQTDKGDKRVFSFVFKNELAKKLISTQCTVGANFHGSVNGGEVWFNPVGDAEKKIILQKGMNKVTMAYTYWW